MSRTKKSPEVVAECHGVKVPASPFISEDRIKRINKGRYEHQEIAGALAVVRPEDRVLEMGAGLGVVGAVTAARTKPAAMMSFEANPNLLPHIETLYALNGLDHMIDLRHGVIQSDPDAPDAIQFHLRSNSFLGSSLLETEGRVTQAINVPTQRYEALRKSFAPTVLIMDIEGGELDFLRHADLSGLRAIVVEFHPLAYGREGMVECKDYLTQEGFEKVGDCSTRLVWTCVRQETLPKPVVHGGWTHRQETLTDAIVVPPTDKGFVQNAGVLHSDGRPCPEGALWRNGRILTEAPEIPEGEMAELPGRWLWGGVLWKHFGHFLVESTSRLWALEHLDAPIDGILFVPKRVRIGSEVMDYQRDFVALMGTKAPVVSLDQPTRVEELIVPGQGFGLGKLIFGTQLFRDAVASRFARDVAPEGPKRLYLSRSRFGSRTGNLLGEKALEAELVKSGYTIFHPQEHDLLTQIAHYKAADQIIAAEGSALHLLAFAARPEQHVAIVARRESPATRQLEKHLRSFSGVQPLTLIHLNRSWKPTGTARSRNWMGELDMPSLQAALAEEGFIKKTKRKWKPLDENDIKERLGEGYEIVT